MDAGVCWLLMHCMCQQQYLLGIIPMCLKAIQMFFIANKLNIICTVELSLSGLYTPTLLGPTPHCLILPTVPSQALAPGTALPLVHCHVNPVTHAPNNYRTYCFPLLQDPPTSLRTSHSLWDITLVTGENVGCCICRNVPHLCQPPS